MVAFYSFGSQRAAQAMGDDYLQHLSDRGAAASAQTRSGRAIVEQLFPGRVYDQMRDILRFSPAGDIETKSGVQPVWRVETDGS